MEEIIALVIALLPAVLLWLYVWKKDARPEPTSWLVRAILLGVAICIPVAILETGIEFLFLGDEGESNSFFGTIFDAFFVAAIPEESFKLLGLWLLLRKNPYFDEHFDGIVYAVCIGLGFAAVENVFYVVGDEDWLSVAIGRALLSVPGHYAFAVLMGYYYSVYHFVDHTPPVAVCVLLVPVVAHGVFDTLAMSGNVNPYLGAACFFILIFFCIKMHKSCKKHILTLLARDADNQEKMS